MIPTLDFSTILAMIPVLMDTGSKMEQSVLSVIQNAQFVRIHPPTAHLALCQELTQHISIPPPVYQTVQTPLFPQLILISAMTVTLSAQSAQDQTTINAANAQHQELTKLFL